MEAAKVCLKKICTGLLVLTLAGGSVPVGYTQIVGNVQSGSKAQVAAAEAEGQHSAPTRAYHLEQDVEMNGVTSRFTWYFSVDKNWSVGQGTVTLYYSLSQLLLPDQSSMTLYLNDHPFKSFALKPKRLNELQKMVVALPLADLKAGMNTLTIKGTGRLSESYCCDDTSVSNWIRLHQASEILLSFEDTLDSEALFSYPSPFGGLSADRENPVRVMIENPKNNDQLAAGMTMMAFLGSQTEKPSKQLKLTTYRPDHLESGDQLIYMGSLQGLPAELKARFPMGQLAKWKDPKGWVDVVEPPKPGDVLLAKWKNPESRQRMLLILSDDGNQLMRGVQALQNPDLVQQMDQPQIVIKPNWRLEAEATARDPMLKLSDLGVDGMRFTGPYRQVASFGINMAGKQISDLGAKAVFNFRYSENLDFKTALMSVFINDIPIGSKRLTLKGAAGDHLEVALPKEVKGFSYDEVKIVFDLEIDRERCAVRPIDMPWAYVTSDSYLYLPVTQREVKLFQDLPAPFVENQNLAPTELVVPSTLTNRDLESLGKFFAWLGTSVKGNINPITVMRSEDWTPDGDKTTRHVLLYDQMAKGRASEKINEALWFKGDDGFTKILSNEKLQLLPEYQKYAGFIELKNMPSWNNKALMAVYSLDEEQLPLTLEHLYDDQKRSKLSGDAAVIGLDNGTLSFRFQKDPVVKEKPKLTDIKKETLQMGLFAAIVALFFAIGIGISLYRNRGEKKS